uniref:DUF4537 domain-containing protein n=1 Tax=Cyclopterus lumpus TaxID=8103 RepID=A0A8C3AFW1_CYCLU
MTNIPIGIHLIHFNTPELYVCVCVFLGILRSPRCSLGNPCTRSGQTMGGPEFYTGGRVLARREADGFYYPGTGRGGVWVVEFDHPGGAGLGGVSPRRQVVCSLDMANQARGRPRPGDAVLSPWEPDLRRYGPGRVMAAAAAAHIDGFGGRGVKKTYFKRIVRELQVQTSASSRCCSWVRTCSSSCRSSSCRSSSCSSSSCSSSCSCSSCSCSSCTPRPLCTDCCPPSSRCCSVSNHRPRSFPPSCGSGFGRAEWDKPPDLRDTDVWRSDPGVPSSSSSSSSSSEDESRVLKLRSKQPRPPWRYWRQTGPEPQHTQTGGKHRCLPLRFIHTSCNTQYVCYRMCV